MLSEYTGNHGKQDGIQEYFSIIRHVAGRQGGEVVVSDCLLSGAINFVIDEFTNRFTNEELADFKSRHSELPIVFVLTEFVEKHHGVWSLSDFGGLFESALIVAGQVMLLPRMFVWSFGVTKP